MAELTELVSYELDGGVARIGIDDGKRNVFSIPMLRALHAAFDRAESDEAVVILTGREGCFSAGFDLGVFAAGEQQQILEMLRLGATLAERVLGFGRPASWTTWSRLAAVRSAIESELVV
jgi:enoyl-CoA hydratase